MSLINAGEMGQEFKLVGIIASLLYRSQSGDEILKTIYNEIKSI